MLFCFGTLKCKVVFDESTESYVRLGWESNGIAYPGCDDIFVNSADTNITGISGESLADNIVCIENFNDFKKKFRLQVWLARGLAIMNWVLTAISVVRTVLHYIGGNTGWEIFIPIAFWATMALLFSPQAFNPTVRDSDGHWVSLVTGKTNLNGGGCFIV